ncbi:hypothetical protein [Paraclostridium bifermentans]|uniref:hypothetical protein n=1 Tax=Paraclostridium bifermentans TaxID=1490 RepID=UPI0022E52FF2|nr:hypothetical protein [Paraclostridium bifermentans]
MADDKVKRLIDYRKRTYALLSMQASFEGSTIVDIVERAIEAYANPSIKEIINAEYGEWEERSKTKKSGRPRTKKPQTIIETVSKDERLENENKKDSKEIVDTNIEENIEKKLLNNSENEEAVTQIEDDEPNSEDDLTDEERELLSCYN